MNWILRRVLREAAGAKQVPIWAADEHEALLEDAGIALCAQAGLEQLGLELLDALGEEADLMAARALAALN